MPLDKGTCLRFYKRPDVQELLLQHAENKEIGTRFNERFGKRPDILHYPKDILELAKKGITSFHCSEEVWHDPLRLNSSITKKEMDELRAGWDLILDIDCAQIEYSKLCADLVIKFLKYSEVKTIYCKFSGNKGFHIAVPFEAFPESLNEKPMNLLFPEAARKIALYITENIKDTLAQNILKFENHQINTIQEKTQLPLDKLIYYEKNEFGDRVPKLNVDAFLEIDTILIASRHLYRMPYSLHEKSGLISLPIVPEEVLKFEKPMANPDKFFMPLAPFIERHDPNVEIKPSATKLLIQAYDFEAKHIERERYKELEKQNRFKANSKQKEYEEIEITSAVTEDFFPPCIKNIMKGMQDGKKRAIFAMINFLGKLGWSKQEIDKFLHDWNKNNPEPLRENIIKGQLAHFKKDKVILPPNCNNEGYYKAFQVCMPDGLCKKIKNPVNYTLIKYKSFLEEKKKEEERTQKEAAKEARKKAKEEKEKRKLEKQKQKEAKELAKQAEEKELDGSEQEESKTTMPHAKHKNLGLAIILNKQNGLLLQDRSNVSKFGEEWGFFGGKIEEGETAKQATIRELQEELEFDISKKELQHLGHYEASAKRESGLIQSISADVYIVKISNEEVQNLVLHEGAGMKWFTSSESLQLKMCPWDKEILNDFQNRFVQNVEVSSNKIH